MADIEILDALTGKTIQRDFTEEEITQREADSKAYNAEVKKQEAEAQAKADIRLSALSKLSALGLTQEEIDSL